MQSFFDLDVRVALRQILIQSSLLQEPIDFRMSKHGNLLIGEGPLDSIIIPPELPIVPVPIFFVLVPQYRSRRARKKDTCSSKGWDSLTGKVCFVKVSQFLRTELL